MPDIPIMEAQLHILVKEMLLVGRIGGQWTLEGYIDSPKLSYITDKTAVVSIAFTHERIIAPC